MRVLVYTEAWGRGGIESLLMNAFRIMRNAHVEFTLFSTWAWNSSFDAELNSMGVKRSSLFGNDKPNQFKRLFGGVREFGHLCDEFHPDAVWINTMNGAGLFYAHSSKRFGVPVRIVHSHNSDVGEGAKAFKRFVSWACSMAFCNDSTVRLACSREAGCYLFGKYPFRVVNNGIDVERFRFRQKYRDAVREELGLKEGEVLVGNIGRIAPAKNQIFQIEIFAEYLRLEPSARYLMLGESESLYMTKVRARAAELGVVDRLIMHDSVAETAPWYSALDAFLLPSLFEGLAMVRVEAQCSGLPILLSDGQASEGNLTELSKSISLNRSAQVWAEELHNMVHAERESRSLYADKVADAGFDLDSLSNTLYTAFGEGLGE